MLTLNDFGIKLELDNTLKVKNKISKIVDT